MAVKQESTVKHFNGLSTDTRPSTDVPEGSTYHVIDTGEHYIYHDSMWETDYTLIWALKYLII